MISLGLIIKNLKLLGAVALICYVIWSIQERKILQAEADRQENNANNLRKFDSIKYSYQVLTKAEVNDYLNYQNKDLKEKLSLAQIKSKTIKQIISTSYKFKDTLIKNYVKGPFIDSSKCLVIKGYADSAGVIITSRDFKNKTDIVAHEVRNQWNFLGIKTRIFGKRSVTATVFNTCGESETVQVELSK